MDASPFVPPSRSLEVLRRGARGCRGCPLYKRATQTVFGEGPARSRLVLVGEQPGDREDREGAPFVGPAGRLLDEALEKAGLSRRQVYVTNAVKHFKFEERGKRRIHKKPGAAEIVACRPWLAAELDAVRPRVIVCLGVTAAGAVDRLLRAEVSTAAPPRVVRTLHPSAVLRAPDHESRQALSTRLVRDLRTARAAAARE